jgi:hydroxyacyl-ACP dehydratase HTD2-like protein with hotdog domain
MNSERLHDQLTPALAARYAATFDRDASLAARYAATFDRDASPAAPQGIHLCLCTPETATVALGRDGHPAGGAVSCRKARCHAGCGHRATSASTRRYRSAR